MHEEDEEMKGKKNYQLLRSIIGQSQENPLPHKIVVIKISSNQKKIFSNL
jgi:hypothetical protein